MTVRWELIAGWMLLAGCSGPTPAPQIAATSLTPAPVPRPVTYCDRDPRSLTYVVGQIASHYGNIPRSSPECPALYPNANF